MAPKILISLQGLLPILIFSGCLMTSRNASAQATPPKPDFGGESFVIEQLKDEVAFNDDGTGQEDQVARIRIQSEAGVQRFGVLSFSYRNERDRLEIVQIRVHKPDSSIVDTPDSNVQDLPADVTREAPTYSDLHEKQIPVKALGVGDTLEWHTRTVHLKADAAGHFWYTRDFIKDAIVLEQSLQITAPAGKYVKVSSPDLKPEIREAGGRKTYSWKTSNLSHPKEEDNEKKIRPRVRPQPAVQLTTFRSWEELGRWYAELQKPKVEVTPAIQAKVAELTANLKTDAEKERALYRFVASNFRYISISFGDGWYQPHSAAEVLANQYGDCKDKHTLLATLLKAAGIEAWPALIGAGNTIDPDVPSPGQFNHVITYLPRGNGAFLDSTAEIAPYGMLTSAVREQHALVIPEQGVPALKDTPDGSLFPNEETVTIQSKLNSEGTLTGDFEIVLRGDDELVLRSVFHTTAPKDWSTLAQNLSKGMGYAGTVRDLDVSNPVDTSGPFRFSYKYERKNYADWDNRRITPPVPPLSFKYSGEEDKPTQPLDLNTGKFTYRATVALPDGYSADIPADVRLDLAFGSYTASYSVDKGILSAERVLTFKKTKLAVNEWEAYGKFVKAVVADETQFTQLVRANAETGPTVLKRDDSKAAELLQKAAEALQRRDLSSAREALAQAERLNPQQSGLWAMYGGLYGLQGQNQKATEALQKEIQYHPGTEPIYLMLAELQEHAGQQDAAIATLSKLVKIAPSNSQGAVALANLLMQQKKYTEAVAPLEGALKENPNETRLELALVEALLRQGKKADGLAVLTKLREHASEPEDLNSAAYILADTNTDLDLAKEMSEKAAAGFAEQTKDVTLANVTSDHFALINTLGATWDTVGWAYFRAGDMAKAEKYVTAAWVLLQHPVAADHLGQIFERQGKKAEAIHAYQLSLAANHDQPDTRKRLENLGGAEEEAPVTLRRGKPTGPPRGSLEDELSQMRTTRLPELPTRMATAEFFLLFSPAGVQDVRFIKGDEVLKTATTTLGKVHYPMTFPGQGPEKIVRRGILSCSKYTTPSCTFVLLLPANTTTN